ncbi:hypothetical protein LJB63_25080, partial [[Eubacterium] rectale]|nr:hypothetical protein [Agathobacter rectalis]
PGKERAVHIEKRCASFFPIVRHAFILYPFPLTLNTQLFHYSPLNAQNPGRRKATGVLKQIQKEIKINGSRIPR